MIASKRRPASTQAVSRKVEGIELRKQDNREDDAFNLRGSQHGHNRKGKVGHTPSESETMACVTLRLHGNPGGPVVAFGGTCRSKRRETLRVCQTTAQREGGKGAAGSRIVK
jgi:hypothetical protein